MRTRCVILSLLAGCATAAEDPLALNDPLRQLLIDTTTKGDGDFLTREERTLPLESDAPAERPRAGLNFEPTDPLLRFKQAADTNAIPQLEAYLRQNPGRAEAWQLMGEIRFRQRDFAGAEQAFGRAYELAPQNGRSLNDYAAALIMQSKLPQAAELLENELARRPGHHAARFNLACVAVRRGRPAAALEQLRRLEREQWADLALHIADSDLDPLRRLPEFVALQSRVTAARSRPSGL